MSKIAPARLAELPPQRWEETKARLASVERFLAQDDRSTRAMKRFADELGVSRPMFYKLLSLRERWLGQDDVVRLPRQRRARDAVGAATIEEAIALCGPAATQGQVYEAACRLTRHRGLEAPNRTQIRRLHGRRVAGDSFGARLGTGTAAVLDAAGLGARVLGRRERYVLPVLSALIDPSGSVVDWIVTAGAPSGLDLGPLLQRARARHAPDGVLISSAFTDEALAENGRWAAAAADGSGVRKGSALVAAVGLKVGRIALLPWTSSDAAIADLPLVSLDDLRVVLRVLLPVPR